MKGKKKSYLSVYGLLYYSTLMHSAVCVYVCVSVCVRVRVSVCVCVCVCVLSRVQALAAHTCELACALVHRSRETCKQLLLQTWVDGIYFVVGSLYTDNRMSVDICGLFAHKLGFDVPIPSRLIPPSLPPPFC